MIQFLFRFLFPVVVVTAIVAGAAGKSPAPGSSPERTKARQAHKSVPGYDHYLTARAFERARLYEDALREIDLAIAADSKKVSYHDARGLFLEKLGRYDDAIFEFNRAWVLDPHNSFAQQHLAITRGFVESAWHKSTRPEGDKWLGISGRAVPDLQRPIQKSFETEYRRGIESFRSGQFGDAAAALDEAVRLKPTDFDANRWRGMALVRLGKFVEAIPNFEKAHEQKPEDKLIRLELFGGYLGAQQPEKALAIFPMLVAAAGGVLLFIYLLVLGLLLPFSVPIRTALFPGFRFSVVWLALYWEGQIAFFLLFAGLLQRPFQETVLMGLSVAAIPIILVAATAFVRQPWGSPFRWPLRLGDWRTIGFAVLVIVVLRLIVAVLTQAYLEVTNKPLPLQYIVPVVKNALQTNPWITWAAVAVVVPVVEEVLFRGLLYGALEKRWGFKVAIVGSAIFFTVFHLQFIGFFSVFVLGVLFAWARYRTNSIGLPILLHGLNNALAVVMLIFFGDMIKIG